MTEQSKDAVAQALLEIARRMPSEETLRTDHPLMGQTFGELAQAILTSGNAIENGLCEVADAIRELAKVITKT